LQNNAEYDALMKNEYEQLHIKMYDHKRDQKKKYINKLTTNLPNREIHSPKQPIIA